MSTRPRVFLVDDHALVLSGLRAELGDSVEVVGEASEVEAAIEMKPPAQPVGHGPPSRLTGG